MKKGELFLTASVNDLEIDDTDDPSFKNGAVLSTLKPSFVWNDISGATSYEVRIWDSGRGKAYIYKSTEKEFTMRDELEYSIVKDGEFKPFKWQVYGVNSFQYMPGDEIWEFIIKNGVPPTVEITSPSDQDVVNATFEMNFNANDDLSVETVEYSIDGGAWQSAWQKPDDVLEAKVVEDKTALDLSSLTYGAHTICIRATDMHGNVSIQADNPNSCIGVIILPPAPGLVTESTDPCNTMPAVEWSAVDGVTYYEIDISTSQDFSSYIVQAEQVNSTTYNVKTGLSNGTYYWRVKSVYQDGTGNTYRSDYSSVKSFTVNRPCCSRS